MTKKTVKDVLKHWFHVNRIFIKHFGIINWVCSECYTHDLDKIIPIIFKFYSKEKHRNKSKHHLKNVYKKFIYNKHVSGKICFEMISDWESSRLKKKGNDYSASEYWNNKRKEYNDDLFCVTVNHVLSKYKFLNKNKG